MICGGCHTGPSSVSALVYVAPSINVCEWNYKELYGKPGHNGRQSPKN